MTMDPLFLLVLVIVVLSLLAVLSDAKNFSLDCTVFAAVAEVRGAGVGVVVMETVVLKVDSLVVRGALGLGTTVV